MVKEVRRGYDIMEYWTQDSSKVCFVGSSIKIDQFSMAASQLLTIKACEVGIATSC